MPITLSPCTDLKKNEKDENKYTHCSENRPYTNVHKTHITEMHGAKKNPGHS